MFRRLLLPIAHASESRIMWASIGTLVIEGIADYEPVISEAAECPHPSKMQSLSACCQGDARPSLSGGRRWPGVAQGSLAVPANAGGAAAGMQLSGGSQQVDARPDPHSPSSKGP